MSILGIREAGPPLVGPPTASYSMGSGTKRSTAVQAASGTNSPAIQALDGLECVELGSKQYIGGHSHATDGELHETPSSQRVNVSDGWLAGIPRDRAFLVLHSIHNTG